MKYLNDDILPLVAEGSLSPRELALLELYHLQPTASIVSIMQYYGWNRRIAKYTSYLLHRKGYVIKSQGKRLINEQRLHAKTKKGTTFVPPEFISLFSEYFSNEKHQGLKNYLLYKCNLPPEYADDILQTTYLKAIQRNKSFEIGTNFNAWLWQIMKNTMYDYLEEQKKQRPCSDMDIYPSEKKETCPELPLHLLDVLPDELRIALHYSLHGLSVADIAILMDIPQGTVKSRVHRAKKIMQEKLKDKLATIQD